MKKYFALFLLMATSLPSVNAQIISDIFHIDRTPEERICSLPKIYFKAHTAELEQTSLEDMAFLAYIMQKNRKITLKVRTTISPNPEDATHKLLTEERLSYFIWLMKDRYGIPEKRIAREDYRQLSRGYSPEQSKLPLDRRSLECDCVWGKKQKKRHKKERKAALEAKTTTTPDRLVQ